MGGRVCQAASSVVQRTLATRGRKREAPRRQAWGDGAKRKVRRTIPLADTAPTMKKEDDLQVNRLFSHPLSCK